MARREGKKGLARRLLPSWVNRKRAGGSEFRPIRRAAEGAKRKSQNKVFDALRGGRRPSETIRSSRRLGTDATSSSARFDFMSVAGATAYDKGATGRAG